MKRSDTVLKILAILCAAALAAILGYAVLSRINKLGDENTRLQAELSSSRIQIYTALSDISAGDEIVTEGDDANVSLKTVYSSLSESLYFDGTEGYAARDIAEGEAVYASAVNDEQQPESAASVVVSYETAYLFPYIIKAVYLDEEGEEISSSKILQLPEGVTELLLSTCSADPDGYVLSSIEISGEEAYSIGIYEIQEQEGTSVVSYYTGEGGLERAEITEDLEIEFIYAQEEE